MSHWISALRCGVALSALWIGPVAGAPPKSERGTPDLDELLTLYKDYGLPLPPDAARLVRFPNGTSTQDDSGKHIPFYALGFWLNPTATKELPEILVGPVHFRYASDVWRDPPQRVDPKSVSLDHVEPGWRTALDPLNAALATLIQCHARGYEPLARRLVAPSLSVDRWGGPGAVWGNAPPLHPNGKKATAEENDRALKVRLAELAWNYWEGELLDEKSDWHGVASRLTHLLEVQPALEDDSRRRLIQSIEEALEPSRSKPGSIEALIDDLVNVTNQVSAAAEPDARILRVEALGFDTVPALIAHCQDQRLTHSANPRVNNFPPSMRVVGEVVSDILQHFAGEDLGTDSLPRALGQGVRKDEVQKWWDDARKATEETYAVAHIFRRADKMDLVNDTWLRVMERKYPARLPEIYDQCLASAVPSAEIAKAIGRAALSKDEKLRLLQRGLQSENPDHQHWALVAILPIDPALANAAIVKRLDDLPEKTSGPVWTSWEAAVAHLAMESDSPEVWRALLRAAQRADVSLRMELMNPMDYLYIGERQRQQRLAFLAAFLDDQTERDRKSDQKLYSGPCAGFEFDRITVRDFAAFEIAHILKAPEVRTEEWTPEKWAQLRQKVKVALAQER